MSSFAELPSNLLVYFIIDNPIYGRKKILFKSFFLCFLLSFLIYFLASLGFLFFIAIGLIKFFINSAFCVIFPYTSELYSTSLRTTAVGLSVAVSSLGGVLMPFICFEFFAFGANGPLLAFAGMAMLSAFSTLFI